MPGTAKSAHPEVQRRRRAVTRFRAGQKPAEIATQLQRSHRWVYSWVAYPHRPPHPRFRSASSAPHHHPNQTPRQVERQILHFRQSLIAPRNPRLRSAPAGARTLRRELNKRRVKPCPSRCTIPRSLRRHGLTAQTPADAGLASRPHPSATYPHAGHAPDLLTRGLAGGPVVQTCTPVDPFRNTADATIHAEKNTEAARAHLLATWRQLGVPDLAQFDTDRVFSGGPHPHVLSALVRLCLSLGIAVLFTPLAEADSTWQIETCNHLWAAPFWDKPPFSHRWRLPPAVPAFWRWYDTASSAPRQDDPPARLRAGPRLTRLPQSLAARIPAALPLSAGLVPALRWVSAEGQVRFLKEPFSVGKRYRRQYVWLTWDTAPQRLTVSSQAQAEADWRLLKVFASPLAEPVQPVLNQFAYWQA